MLKTLKKNDRGIIFVTVLMIIIVMMVLTISVMSINVSQVRGTEGEIRRVQAEMLSVGELASQYATIDPDNPPSSIPSKTVILGCITYTIDTVYNSTTKHLNITTTFPNP